MSNERDTKLDRIVTAARKAREDREQGYREKALKMYPHVCGRCGREFERRNLHELTVHHRNHDHDCNPEDGSNWELLCLYCHDNEHQRQLEAARAGSGGSAAGSGSKAATHNPFADLRSMLEKGNDKE